MRSLMPNAGGAFYRFTTRSFTPLGRGAVAPTSTAATSESIRGSRAVVSGSPCQSGAMPNGKCRMHGGASPGAPKGERNGNYKHGHFTQEAVEFRRYIRALIAQMLTSIDEEPRP